MLCVYVGGLPVAYVCVECMYVVCEGVYMRTLAIKVILHVWVSLREILRISLPSP